MFQNLTLFRSSALLAHHASVRQAVTAENIANADTPEFRTRRVRPFADVWATGADGMKRTRPAHTNASNDPRVQNGDIRSELSPNGNSVSLEEEMVEAALAQSDHSKALAIYRHGLTVMRAVASQR